MKYIKSATDEEEEIDGTLEFSLNDDEIENMIAKLRKLQNSKSSIRIDINNIAEIIIKYKKKK